MFFGGLYFFGVGQKVNPHHFGSPVIVLFCFFNEQEWLFAGAELQKEGIFVENVIFMAEVATFCNPVGESPVQRQSRNGNPQGSCPSIRRPD